MTSNLGLEKESESIYQLLQNGPDMVVITDYDAQIIAINKRAVEVTGFTADEVIGANPNLWNSGRQSENFYKNLWDTIKSGEIWEGSFCNRKKNGDLFWTHAIIVPIFDDQGKIIKFASVHDNITKQHRLRERLRATVDTTGSAIITMDSDGVIEDINSAGLSMFECSRQDVVNKKIRIIMPETYKKISDYKKTGNSEIIKGRDEDTVKTRAGLEFPADVEINEFETDTGQKFVAIAIDRTEEVKYRNKIEQLNARKDQELEIGREIQQELLPDYNIDLDLYEIGLKYKPSTELGGDFYNFFNFEENDKTLICLADAAGHGVPAALLSTLFKAQSDLVLTDSENLSESISILNQRLNELLPKGKFISTFFLLLDHKDREIEFFKCSQEPGLLLKSDGELKTLETGGVLLGAFEQSFLSDGDFFSSKKLFLKKGERIILYTDGVTEAENPEGAIFGEKRFYNIINEYKALKPNEFSDRVLSDVQEHAQSKQLDDDFSIIAIDVN